MAPDYPQTIENIPSGILSCRFADREVTVTELSPEHIRIRLSTDFESKDTTLILRAFFWGKGYETLSVNDAVCVECTTDDIQKEITLEIQSEAYFSLIQKLQKQLYTYINDRLEADGNDFSEKLTGYPSHRDLEFSGSYEEWLALYEPYLQAVEEWVLKQQVEIALSLETVTLCRAYLSDTLQTRLSCRRLYIGNAFCHNQFPDSLLLTALLDKASGQALGITIVLPYLRESVWAAQEQVLTQLYTWAVQHRYPIELELNDYGWFLFFREWQPRHPGASEEDFFPFSYNYGRLLNKRRKDPRSLYKDRLEDHMEQWGENSLNDPSFPSFLSGYGIRRYEQESCGYPLQLPKGRHSLHMPFYQTNTSQYCPLKAVAETGDRGKQRFCTTCDRICETKVLLYPDHLAMVGRYNSIFALDTRIPETDFDDYSRKGVDRIVWNHLK